MLTLPMRYSGSRIRVKDCPFGAPDGTANQFQLVDRHGHAVTKDVRIASIYQTDWQGRVELSDQERTNYAPAIDHWSNNGAEITVHAADGPDGSPLSATKIVASGAAVRGPYKSNVSSITAGQHIAYQIAHKHLSGDQVFRITIEGAAFFNSSGAAVAYFDTSTGGLTLTAGAIASASSVDLLDGWRIYKIEGVAQVDGSYNLTGYNGSLEDNEFLLDKPQVGSTFGAYIPTTSSPGTVTDYTHDGQGGITTGQVPSDGAALDWTGTARRAA